MKKRHRILYYTVLVLIILIAGYNFIEKVIVSSRLKNSIIENLKPVLRADEFDIRAIDLNFNKLIFKNIIYSKENTKVIINSLIVEFSVLETISKYIRTESRNPEIRSVIIDGCRIIIEPQTATGKPSDWDFAFDDFKSVLGYLAGYDFIREVGIRNVDLIYRTDITLPFISDMKGAALFKGSEEIELELTGTSLHSQKENIRLSGKIGLEEGTAVVKVSLKKNKIPEIRIPFKSLELTGGEYSGSLDVDINTEGRENIFISGDLSLDDINISFNEKLYLRNITADLSMFNGTVKLNSLNGSLNGLDLTGEGTVMNIFNPSGDVFIDIKNISGSSLKKAVLRSGTDEKYLQDVVTSDGNYLKLHISDRIFDPEIKFDMGIPGLIYSGHRFNDIEITGYINGTDAHIQKGGFMFLNNFINISGDIKNIISDHPSYDIEFKSTGALFSRMPFFDTPYLKSLSSLVRGNISGTFGKTLSLKSEVSLYDFDEKEDQKVISADISMNKGLINLGLFGKDGKKAASGEYDLRDKKYSVKGQDLRKIYEIAYGKTIFEGEKNIGFRLEGSGSEISLRAGSDDPSSVFYGEFGTDIDLDEMETGSFVNWMPYQDNMYIRPANFRFRATGQKFVISDLYFDSKEIKGSASLDLRTKGISGELETTGMDFGKFFGVKGLNTHTDMFVNLGGNIRSPYIDIFINENILHYNDGKGDSVLVSGEAEIHLEDEKVRIEKVIVYDGMNRIITLSGKIYNMNEVELNTYGEINASMFNVFFDKNRIGGNIKYKADFTGRTNDIRLGSSQIRFTDGYFNDDRINSIDIVTSELDSSGVLVKRFFVDAGAYMNLDAEGYIPYDEDSEVYVTGNYYGDLIGYIDSKTELISEGYSECEAEFTIEGTYKKPKIAEAEIYIIDGRLKPKGSPDVLDRIRSKLYIDSNSNLDIVKLLMRSPYNDGTVTIQNSAGSKKYGDIMLPGGINIGYLSVKTGEEGINYHAPRMMLPDDFGNFTVSGKEGDSFLIYKKSGNLVLDGKLFVRRSRITFPFLPRQKKKKAPSGKMRSIYSDIELDLEVIPSAGNSYFYNIDSEESSFWNRIVKTFTELDNKLSNVNVNLSGSNQGLTIQGELKKPKEFRIRGVLTGNKGSCDYSALTFRVENVSIRFDGQKNSLGRIDPYLKATGKTVVRTKIDSTGYSGYENIYLKVVTKEDGIIVDSEGARISDLSIILTDEYDNPWLERDEEMSDIDTGGTVTQLFNEAVDKRVLSPFISPIESALGRFLSAQVSIRPNITGNFLASDFGVVEIPETYAGYFVGSEFYISKFLTDNLALTWSSKYIGSEEYTEVTERDYGYSNNLSFDYRLNNYIFSSAGYEYDSIKDEYGYNLKITYRYRFFNITEPFEYLKNLYYRIAK